MEHESVGRDLETNESTPKLLATLRDHLLLTVLGGLSMVGILPQDPMAR